MANKTKLIMGVIGAMAAGVIVGLLIAPERGNETRKKIKDTAGDWAGHLSDIFANAKGELDNLRKKGTKAATDPSGTYNDIKESYS
ncbi:MAG TPA: YtxH domain-containing protein [Flavisolibacter sp.]|nr:YtxH domain-containing protein [Flavisolibacter sp.]